MRRAEARLIRRALGAILLGIVATTGCSREERRFRAPATEGPGPRSLSELHPGQGTAPPVFTNPHEGNSQAIAEGRRLYVSFNCAGCHFNGGGGIGPALMDDKWIYGNGSVHVFATIVEGRPNGMPSFRGRLTEDQVWKIAAYVRSLGGTSPRSSPDRDGERPAEESKRGG